MSGLGLILKKVLILLDFIMLEGFGVRLRETRESLKKNQAEFAELGGAKKSSQFNYEAGKTAPTVEYLLRLATHGVDIAYLLTGERRIADQLAEAGNRRLVDLLGPSIANRLSQPARAQIAKIVQNQGSRPFSAPIANDDELVEVAEIDARYGLGATFVDGELVEATPRRFSAAWLRTITTAPPALLFWTVGRGNSMSPTIEDGEVLLCDRSQTLPDMDDLIWVCALGETGMIKRIRIRADHMKLMADNQAVADELVYADDNLQIVGRVVAVVKNL